MIQSTSSSAFCGPILLNAVSESACNKVPEFRLDRDDHNNERDPESEVAVVGRRGLPTSRDESTERQAAAAESQPDEKYQ